MLTSEPGGTEHGVISFAIVDALLDALVAKDALTRAEAVEILTTAANKLSKQQTLMGKRCAQIITDGIPR